MVSLSFKCHLSQLEKDAKAIDWNFPFLFLQLLVILQPIAMVMALVMPKENVIVTKDFLEMIVVVRLTFKCRF